MAITNKRSHPRFDSLNLLAYFVYDAEGTMIQQGMGRTLNVSQSGILLETHISVDSEHEIALSIGLEENLVDIKGKAVYSKAGKNGMFETGIEFLEIDEAQKSVLTEFIKAFEAQQT